jgi:hypothetical protein
MQSPVWHVSVHPHLIGKGHSSVRVCGSGLPMTVKVTGSSKAKQISNSESPLQIGQQETADGKQQRFFCFGCLMLVVRFGFSGQSFCWLSDVGCSVWVPRTVGCLVWVQRTAGGRQQTADSRLQTADSRFWSSG